MFLSRMCDFSSFFSSLQPFPFRSDICECLSPFSPTPSLIQFVQMGIWWCWCSTGRRDDDDDAHGGFCSLRHNRHCCKQHMHGNQSTADGEYEAKVAQGAGPQLPPVQLHQHQVLLLQQLQPRPAPLLLQDLPEVLDRRWVSEECPCGRRLQKEQEILSLHHCRRRQLFLLCLDDSRVSYCLDFQEVAC